MLIVEDEEAFFRSVRESGSVGRAPGPAHAGAHVYLPGPEDFPRLFGLPPDDLALVRVRHDGAWWKAARAARTRALRLAVSTITRRAAERFGVDLGAWSAELVRASEVEPDRLRLDGESLLRGLRDRRELRFVHDNDTELTVRPARASAFLDDGRPDPSTGAVWGRMPAGLLIVPIDPASVEGVWASNRPIYDRFAQPPVAVGGRLEFRRGRLVDLSFERGGEPILAAYSHAGRGRDRATALTFGLNPEVVRAPESLELGQGTIGLLIGDRPGGRGPVRSGFSLLAPLAGASMEGEDSPAGESSTQSARRR